MRICILLEIRLGNRLIMQNLFSVLRRIVRRTSFSLLSEVAALHLLRFNTLMKLFISMLLFLVRIQMFLYLVLG